MLKKTTKLITTIALVISLALTITPIYNTNAQNNNEGMEQYEETGYQLFNPNYDEEAACAWLNNFELEEDPATAGKVILVKYLGTEEILNIPATVEIDSIPYDVRLCDTPFRFMNTNAGVYNTTTKTITFDHNIDTSNVKDMSYMFENCTALESVDMSGFNTSNVTDMSYMFMRCSHLTNPGVSSFNTSKVTNMNSMFDGCSSLTSLNLSNFDTTSVTRMASMFGSCSSLSSLNLSSKFDTTNVTNMSFMFNGCSSLTGLNVSHFNTSNVTDMHYMFTDCSSLTGLNVSNFNTAKVTTMASMFEGCSSLTSLDLSNFNTTNVTDMSQMFEGCSAISSLNISSFNTANVTDTQNMFRGCSSLTSLDLSNFDLNALTNYSLMLDGCTSLQTINTPVNLQKDIALPGTFVRLDNPQIPYTMLPTDLTISYTIIRDEHVTGITVSPTSKTIKVGENFIITPTVTPADATDKVVTWSSSNNAIASVDTTGKVTGLSTGTATITATTHDGGLTATCTVTVSNTTIKVTGITLDTTAKTMGVGETYNLKPTITPSNATDKSVEWFSGNPAVASVDTTGKVTAKAIGVAVITATTHDGEYKATCTITVSNSKVSVTGIELTTTSRNMYAGDQYILQTIIKPDNATDKSVTWTSSNPAIATVDENGIVLALKAGTTTITATTNDGGFKANCIITVTGEVVNVTGITLSPTTKTMYAGESSMLMPTVTPDNATNRSVTWTSSDPTIASVDENGMVKAIKKGTATITAKTDDGGFTATCVITVNEGDKKVTGITLTPTTNTIKPGDSFIITPTVTPSDAADKSVTWSSSDSSIARVDSTGKVTALKAGTVTITATTNDGGYKATCTVTVANITNIYIYRLYNPNSGEHFFTNNDGERKYLASIGWDDEGVAWMSPSSSNVPVYRLFNPFTSEHHYTSNLDERNYLILLGWNDEGISWYSTESHTKGTPIYRLFNPYISGIGAHHYTQNESERNYLRTIGWNYEGIGWYGI